MATRRYKRRWGLSSSVAQAERARRLAVACLAELHRDAVLGAALAMGGSVVAGPDHAPARQARVARRAAGAADDDMAELEDDGDLVWIRRRYAPGARGRRRGSASASRLCVATAAGRADSATLARLRQ